MTTPTDPTSGSNPAQPTPPAENKSPEPGWNPKPLKWLGMTFDSDQTKKLWNIISQNISNQINSDKEKAIKALRKLGQDQDKDSDD